MRFVLSKSFVFFIAVIGYAAGFTRSFIISHHQKLIGFDNSSCKALQLSRTNHANENNKSTSTPASIPLNREIFRLRKSKNGISLAERRLNQAIEYMFKEDDTAKKISTNRESVDSDQLSQFPDETSFNSVLSGYAKTRQDWSAPKAEQLLRRMQKLSEDYPYLAPSIFTYNCVLEAYSNLIATRNSRRSEKNRLAVLRLFEEIENCKELEPNTYTNNLLLSANEPSSDIWKSSEKWALDFLEGHSGDLIPDRFTYNTLLKCYGLSGQAQKALSVINKIFDMKETVLKNYGVDLQPNLVIFHLVLKSLAMYETKRSSSRDFSAGEKADAILARMYELSANGVVSVAPNTETYNHVLNVHAKSGDTCRAEALVKELEETGHPDVFSYTTLVKAYANKQHLHELDTELLTKIASNATKVFRKMKSLSKEGISDVSPTIVTYNTILDIWTRCGTREGLEIAMDILQELNDDRQCWPDSVTYTTLIHGWSREHITRLPEAGRRAEQLLLALENLPPNRIRPGMSRTTVYNSVITSWKYCAAKIAAQRVDALLQRLEGKYFNGDMNAQPDKTTFLCMINAYATAGIPDADERCDALLQRMFHFRDVFGLQRLDPDVAVYNAVLNALAKSRQPNAIDKAEEILTMMQTSPDKGLRPDIVTYATVIDCHTKCGDGSHRADELLRFVEGSYRGGDTALKPNAVFYSAILQAHAKTATDKGARKAEELLRRNLGLYEQGYDYAKPHAIIYNAVIDAIARSGVQSAGEKCEDLLNEMISLYEAGNGEMKPSRRSFNACILGYRKEGDGGKKAEEVLMRMEELSNCGSPEIAPDVVSYNCAIGAIVDSEEEDAADRAQALLDRMEDRNIRPDGRTYSSVIEAWLRRRDEKGKAIAEAMLKKFLERVEASKKLPRNRLYEDAVWEVVNAYK